MKPQTSAVLDYMRTHDGITTLEAFLNLGVTRLSARIWDLREEGHEITATRRRVLRRDGSVATVALYILKEGSNV